MLGDSEFGIAVRTSFENGFERLFVKRVRESGLLTGE